MSINNEQKQAFEERRPRGMRNLLLSLIVCVVVIAGLGGFFVWHSATTSNANNSRPSIEYMPPTPPQALTDVYKQAVEEQLAQGLHLSTGQLKTRLAANSDDLFGVAQQQGVNDIQISTLLVHAFQAATARVVTAGTWTQQQGNAEMQYWQGRSSKALAGDVTSWLLA